ncbi:winged helix DNA-binding domain-containing protein [Williamsia deligens]|uniref:Winged helix DNA-binding domain-containing protein n=1 Tax=Williamsia deligens TaxID=321325 RepID=A0ABW3GAZ1_9NOCA|nr:winged helix DNA-binding domain-containing protein [Williamsia deligens]MCP2193080.1 Winged helix DNA-binding domain-containing protein [Williamsia deligens]
MSTARPRIDVAQRRARMLARHHLVSSTRLDASDPAAVGRLARDLVALHATCPPTVYLAAWARVDGVTPAHLQQALYEDRSLVRHLCMRRTAFVLDRDTLADAIAAVGPRVSASERTNMLRDLRRSPDFPDPEGWIDTAAAAVRAHLADGGDATSAELRERLPELDGRVSIAVDKSWGGSIPMAPRVLNMMSAAGEIVRGVNTGGWHVSRPRWSAMDAWLGGPPQTGTVAEGHVALVRKWLRAFGPGTETDIVWWLGSTKAAVRAAIAELDVVEVDVAVGADEWALGYVLSDDVDPVEPVTAEGFLLPELDPTTMGWKQRDWYLAPHAAHVFDRNGNGGQTAWWDGRIVGGWYRRDDGGVGLHLLEKLPKRVVAQLTRRADALGTWLGEVKATPGYPAPFMKDVAR